MANIIDTLYVAVGLDPSAYKKGAKEIQETDKKTTDQMVKSGKIVEASAKSTAQAISSVTRSVLTLYATFLGARGIKEFIADLNTADASLGRFAANLGQSPQTIAAWGMATERMGGSAEATAGSFERIGKALYDLHRNGQLLPKEFSQLQALTGKRIDTEHGVDKFLRDTASALKAMNGIDPAQAHFLAQGMGIDDATANVMIKYGDAIGAYLDQIKKLSPSNDAIKAAQQLQDQWVTLQQTAVSLANTVLEKLGPTMAKLLKQMTDWLEKNQDWLRSGIVKAVGDFSDYLAKVDWNAIGQGLKDFGNDAKQVADAIGGITTATEVLFALWAGSKALGMLGSLRTALGPSAAATPSASSGGGMMGVLGKIFAVTGAAYMLTDTAPGPSQAKINAAEKNAWYNRGPAANSSGSPDDRDRDRVGREGSLNDFLNQTVDGRPVSKSNPMPVTLEQQGSGGGFWQSVGNFFGGLLGGGGSNDAAPSGGKTTPFVGKTLAAGTPSLTGSNADVVAYIRQAAIKRGIDPNIALRVANHEGLRGFDPTKVDRGGDGNSSFGPFQLHYGGINPRMPHGGLGDEFTKKTGLDARNSSTWKQQIDFALDQVRKGGWGPWMGARAEGITGKMGVGPFPDTGYVDSVMSGARGAALSNIQNNHTATTSSTSNAMHVGTINVNAPQATDSKGIASTIADSLFRSTVAATANSGPQ
ncbi:hypothetical protein RHSP_32076 [Rhizobium freirei PRF 81]|uniref:Uncharacterized protein n=1 Tax=Rhizobium freirei PRF 81 TaxID=363754 RepID=N6V513_9HYPH|nr:hypothetical protein [Rhizobium freirei]ENN86077.1 hypothetical protein RHSP_32076 [Rhizobium freirei PRF 81]